MAARPQAAMTAPNVPTRTIRIAGTLSTTMAFVPSMSRADREADDGDDDADGGAELHDRRSSVGISASA